MPPGRQGQLGDSGGPLPLECVIPRGWAIFQKLRGPLLCQELTFELPGLAAAGDPR